MESKRRALQTTLASRSTRETDRTGSTVARNHLQQFHELRRQFEAKKDALLHDLIPKDRKLRPGVGRGVLPANSAGVKYVFVVHQRASLCSIIVQLMFVL